MNTFQISNILQQKTSISVGAFCEDYMIEEQKFAIDKIKSV